MVVRKITKFLRGKATRGQVLTASVLAGMLGFVPGFFLPSDLGGGFLQAPGLILTLFFLALISNANFGVFAIVTVFAKLASFVLLPITFAIGQWMIDGPMRGVVQSLANAPFTAWFGLDYYATTGGLVVGLVFGIASGIVLFTSLQTYRNRMAALEAGSEAYQQNAKKLWVRLLAWLFLGGGKGTKVTWQELAEGGKKGLPIRIGLGPTRTLSKVANALAKASEKVWKGVVDLHDIELRRRLFAQWPVEEVWGIARAMTERLRPLGVRTTADLAALPPEVARDVGTVVLERLVRELNGVECTDFEPEPPPAPMSSSPCASSSQRRRSDSRSAAFAGAAFWRISVKPFGPAQR
jgi:uncharacterized protein (TIGR03546 family)